MKELTIDDVYDEIGHLGKAQYFYILSLSFLQIFGCHHMLLNIYSGLEPEFSCKGHNAVNNSTQELLQNKCIKNSLSNCEEILYNRSSYKSFAAEWNLVCDEKYKVAAAQTIFMGGVMSGALLLGGLADWIGRLKSLFIAITCLIGLEGFSAFSTSYTMFIILRYFGAISQSILILVSFVLAQELVGRNKRSLCGVSMAVFFSMGIGLLSLLAAYVPDWRTLTLLVSVEGIFFLFIPFCLPESPRWLLSQGRTKEAEDVLTIIATKNNTSHCLPSHWALHKHSGKKQNGNALLLFTHPYLRRLTLIQIFSWFVNSCMYYALTMAASSLRGNVYVSTTLNGLVEIPACLSIICIIDRFGRKFAICNFMLIGGFVCLLIPLASGLYPFAVNILALVGKLSISASFAVIYIHSGEIFPTSIRNTGMGTVSVAARLGGMLSPFVLMLADISPHLHFVLLGLLSIIAGLLNTLLPETLGRPMPESIEDILEFNYKIQPISLKTGSGKGYSRLPQELLEGESEEEII